MYNDYIANFKRKLEPNVNFTKINSERMVIEKIDVTQLSDLNETEEFANNILENLPDVDVVIDFMQSYPFFRVNLELVMSSTDNYCYISKIYNSSQGGEMFDRESRTQIQSKICSSFFDYDSLHFDSGCFTVEYRFEDCDIIPK